MRPLAESRSSPSSRRAAPLCTRHLADLGLVVKVESPGGDFPRLRQRVNGLAAHFVWLNRNKESWRST